MVTSAYLHIPFCKQKCFYCSFVSFSLLERKEEYLLALQKQILAEYNGEPLKTLYLGGGTPSLLCVEEIGALLELFEFEQDAEITLELNPETVDKTFFERLVETRVNRLSIGCQSFDDDILCSIGRRHRAEDVVRVVNEAKRSGFDNISLDFIYGLPNQSLEGFLADLKRAVQLGVQHISLYGLKIDEGCYFSKNPPSNLADDEMQAQMYLGAIDTLRACGFEHYEISNFSLVGKGSQHNINYWRNQEYYGFGLAAHGYVQGQRYSNKQSFEEYLLAPSEKEFLQELTLQEKLEEEIFLGLRLCEGINISQISQKYGVDIEQKYGRVLKKYLSSGHLKYENSRYSFTPEGFLVSSYILADFIEM